MNQIIGVYNCDKFDKDQIPIGSFTIEDVYAVRRRYIINGIVEEESKALNLIVIGLENIDNKDHRIHGFDRYDFLGEYKEVGIEKHPYIEHGLKHKAFILRS